MPVNKVTCSISIDAPILEALDEYVKALGENRSIVIQRFIREGLKRANKKTGA